VNAIEATDWLRVLSDVGYEYDTSFRELRRFVWDVGVTASFYRASFDAGFGGSIYDEPIEWTPQATSALGVVSGQTISLTALEDNEVGTNYVAVRTGFRVRLHKTLTLSGTVSASLTDETFRPDATGTLALDALF
jgi:hypothetical protein